MSNMLRGIKRLGQHPLARRVARGALRPPGIPRDRNAAALETHRAAKRPVAYAAVTLKIQSIAFQLLATAFLTTVQASGGPWAQSESGGLPYSSLKQLDSRETPSITLSNSHPSVAQPLELDMRSVGRWDALPGGQRLWRLRIASPGSRYMGLEFRYFSLPSGASLFIYDDLKLQVHGAYGPENQEPDGGLSVHPIGAQALTLEYFEPAGVRCTGSLVLDWVHDAPGFALKSQDPTPKGEAAGCHRDVSCEEGLAWADLTRSIVKIEGIQNCTGVLLNNTSGDGTPYVLTARHCGNMAWANFWFHWKRKACGEELVAGEQSFPSSFGGSVVIDSPLYDFQLVRLHETPPPAWKVHYAGWDATDVIPTDVVSLHHPWGNVMKISIERQAPLKNKHFWKIRSWDVGITEQGSSGAPLFDAAQRVVGQLKGGPASCRVPKGDLFGRLGPEWELLAPFLDPMQTGALQLDGIDLDPSRLELGILGFAQARLGPEEPSLELRGTGFERHPKVSIDGQRLPGAHARWISNSRLNLRWAGLAPGQHLLSIARADKNVEFKFSVQPAPEPVPEPQEGER